MTQWNLQRLAHFVAVADSASLSQAARLVNLSQPALTKSIRKLEEEVGAALFDRAARVELTPLGRQFLPLARQALTKVGDLERELDLLKGVQTGELKLACGPLQADVLVGPALARLLARHPGLKIHLHVGSFATLPALLRARELDFFTSDISWLQGQEDLEIAPFPPLEIYWFCRPGHPLAHQRKIGLHQLFSFPLVGPDLSDWTEAWIRQNQPDKQSAFRPTLICSHYPALKAVVEGSDAISGATLPAVAADLASGRFVVLNVEAPVMVLRSGAVYLRDRTLSPAAAILIEEMQAIARSQPTIPPDPRAERPPGQGPEFALAGQGFPPCRVRKKPEPDRGPAG